MRKTLKEHLYNLATDKYKGFIFWPLKSLFWLLSLIYGLGLRIIIFFSTGHSCKLNCRVISVGNITLGGTGKTVLVEFIARYLKEQGRKVAILSRGYKRKITDYRLAIGDYQNMGDEPYMLSKKLADIPVIVDADRVRAAELAIAKYGADTLILDDGFQQWRIRKDLDILCVDALEGFGNRHLLPRGILRQPLTALKKPDLFVLTKVNLNPDTTAIRHLLRRFNRRAEIFASAHSPVGLYSLDAPDKLLDPKTQRGRTATLFSGIGAPDSFENLIIGLGIPVGLSFKFPDHHHYHKEDLEEIIKKSQQNSSNIIITTEKDAARLCQLPITDYPLPIFVLRIQLEIIDDAEGFYNRLLRIYPA